MKADRLRELEVAIETARAKMFWLDADELETLKKQLSSRITETLSDMSEALEDAARAIHEAWIEEVRREAGLP